MLFSAIFRTLLYWAPSRPIIKFIFACSFLLSGFNELYSSSSKIGVLLLEYLWVPCFDSEWTLRFWLGSLHLKSASKSWVGAYSRYIYRSLSLTALSSPMIEASDFCLTVDGNLGAIPLIWLAEVMLLFLFLTTSFFPSNFPTFSTNDPF